jgi:hypothetical protein
MPVINVHALRPPVFQLGGQLQTILPGLFRKIISQPPLEVVVPTPDGDELEADIYELGDRPWVVVCHGLEGNSRRPYVLGMTQALLANGYSVAAWNYRSCGNRINKRPQFYHSGATDDLECMVNWVSNRFKKPIYLVGFSLGGNLILKYLGERSIFEQANIIAAAVISVPADLAGSCTRLDSPIGWPYRTVFLQALIKKVKQKAMVFPELFDLRDVDKIRSLREFDDRFTAPLHGFLNAADYYNKCSSKSFIANIRRPVLFITAKNDPFLNQSCFPIHECEVSPFVNLELLPNGGHVGFMISGQEETYPEVRVPTFFSRCE